MKAVVLDRFGGPEVLHLADVPDPQPGPWDVVVEVHAVSLNYRDLMVADGPFTLTLSITSG